MKKIAIIAVTPLGVEKALLIQKEFQKAVVVSSCVTKQESVQEIASVSSFIAQYFKQYDAFCFVSALGICVRTIAAHLSDKKQDPAVICVDEKAMYVQSVIGGHAAGANALANTIARALGATPVVSTASEVHALWPLDTIGAEQGWHSIFSIAPKLAMSIFIQRRPTALLIEVRDKGTEKLERSLPDFVEVFYQQDAIDYSKFALLLLVGFRKYSPPIPWVAYVPKVLHVGTGCSKAMDEQVFFDQLNSTFETLGFWTSAIKNFGSAEIKQNQSAYLRLSKVLHIPFKTFSEEELNTVTVPNPSALVKSKIGVFGVSEACAMLLSGNSALLLEKQKYHFNSGEKCTLAIAQAANSERKGHVYIVGAGPGEESLLTIKGERLLRDAECVLYAGSLIPEKMMDWCKPGAVVRNSAGMDLEMQMALMQQHYNKGDSIVRLQCGDPSLYGAIQEQMTLFDECKMHYSIVPGISSFSAAAAVLKSEFTIPEEVQTIILTRGEGKTPMPQSEKLEEMAKHQATLCLFLSAGIAQKVEQQLLAHYPPDTPVAVMYRLTWDDQEIFQGALQDLAKIVKESKRTRTVLIVVGKAIGARKNRSQLYHPEWQHIFRTNKVQVLPKTKIQ